MDIEELDPLFAIAIEYFYKKVEHPPICRGDLRLIAIKRLATEELPNGRQGQKIEITYGSPYNPILTIVNLREIPDGKGEVLWGEWMATSATTQYVTK